MRESKRGKRGDGIFGVMAKLRLGISIFDEVHDRDIDVSFIKIIVVKLLGEDVANFIK